MGAILPFPVAPVNVPVAGSGLAGFVQIYRWGQREHTATVWYEPFDGPGILQRAFACALSNDVTRLCTVGDVRILSLVLQACENFRPMDAAEREKMIAEGRQFEPLFA
ncbi:MAG: hypothetical protein Fur0016_18200 [Anaerolineales bacterium]